MRSIRLSLMVYFLALLAVALLAASLLVYRNAEQTLASKQQAMEDLIHEEYRIRTRDEERRLDDALLAQATALANVVQVQFDWSRGGLQQLYLLGMIGLDTNAHVLMQAWLAEGSPPIPHYHLPPRSTASSRSDRQPRSESSRQMWLSIGHAGFIVPLVGPPQYKPTPAWQYVNNHLLRSVDLKEQVLLPGANQADNYFQIDFPPGKSYHSPSMIGHQEFPPGDRSVPANQVVPWVYDNFLLDDRLPVRRVVLKASSAEIISWRRSRAPARTGESPRGRRPPPFPAPTIYVHCATQTGDRDAKLAQLLISRDEDLAAIASQTHDSLRGLRLWLLGICLAVFAATTAGTFFLVRLGLSPLQRLCYAVSQVSVKDFRLPLGDHPLPRELRPIADRLRTTLDLLKRAFAREKQAAADISHELRTPLAALMTTTEFALRKPRSSEHYRELLGDVHASAQQMHQIVERLLTLARLDAGVDRLRAQTIDAAALAQQCADVIRPLAEARSLTLTVKNARGADAAPPAGMGERGCVSAPSTLVKVDPDKLREILTNLLHNAIQYNRPGGTIDLRVARQNGTLEVEVQDTGIGIAEEVRDRIFERFFRADPSRGGDDLHAGLGLAIVREYIDLMGGSIGVDSTEGQGSTFRVRLPVR